MTCRRQAIGTHTAVVFLLVGGLPIAGEAHNDIACSNVGIVDHILALHAAGNGGIDDDGARQVAHIGCLAARAIHPDAHGTQFGHQLVVAVDDGADHLTGNQQLVATDGRRDEDIIDSTHTDEVVDVHDEGILCDALPDGEVARLLPVHIGQRRLGAGSIGMHDVAILGIAAQDVGDDLAESLRIEALVDVTDGIVHIFLAGTYAAHHIPLICHVFN